MINNNYEILYFFKFGLELNLIPKEWITNWADQLIMDDKNDNSDVVIDLSMASYSSAQLTILNLELEKEHEIPNLKYIGQALVGLISRKLNKGSINIDSASHENYQLQLFFLQEIDVSLGGFELDDYYQLARQKIVGDYESEKQKLRKYLLDCEKNLNELLIRHSIN